MSEPRPLKKNLRRMVEESLRFCCRRLKRLFIKIDFPEPGLPTSRRQPSGHGSHATKLTFDPEQWFVVCDPPFVLQVLIDPLACFVFRSCNNFLSGHHVFEGKRPATSRSSSLVSIFDTPLNLLSLFCRFSISHAPAFQQEIGIVFQVEGLQARFHCFSSAFDIRQIDEPKCYFDWVLWECTQEFSMLEPICCSFALDFQTTYSWEDWL